MKLMDPNSTADTERRLLSRKEAAKEQRHAAYLKAKQRRASDPRYLAMKEAAKEQRRAAYQQVKERRRAVALEQKAAQKLSHTAQVAARRREADEAVMKLVTGFLPRRPAND